MDQRGLDFLIHEEGVVLHPYKDSVGLPTIGIGSRFYESGQEVKMTDPPITKERATELFKQTLKSYEITVEQAITANLTQNQFNALCSLCYNIGAPAFRKSTVAKTVNLDPYSTKIKDAWYMWKKPPELLPRRHREVEFYFS